MEETITIDGYEYPVVECKEYNHGLQWRFYCRYCRTYHIHGAGEGHRVAHCHGNDTSPYYKTGYYLRLKRK